MCIHIHICMCVWMCVHNYKCVPRIKFTHSRRSEALLAKQSPLKVFLDSLVGVIFAFFFALRVVDFATISSSYFFFVGLINAAIVVDPTPFAFASWLTNLGSGKHFVVVACFGFYFTDNCCVRRVRLLSAADGNKVRSLDCCCLSWNR